jgi:uncharacterized sulfatase
MRLLFTVAVLLSSLGAVDAAERPNVLLFIADDMLYHDCGAYGSDVVRTPSIDRLATEGMRFDRMFTSTAMCAPTRQQLYTGVWPVRNGAYPNHSKVYKGTRSWVQHFKAIGYRCGLAGKNHCNPADSYPWEVVVPAKGSLKMDQIAEFLTRDDDQPYFLVVAHHDPHTPWNHGDATAYPPDSIEVPPYLVDTPETRDALSRYYAEITYMDSELGEVTRMVDENGQRENTIVIFTSEQGSAFPFGGKWTCYENGLRTSFVVRWPERVKAGTQTTAMCQYIDVVPTLLDAVGIDPDSIDTGLRGAAGGGNGFDGRSFLPVLLGNTDRHRNYTFGVHTTRGIINGADYPVRSVRGERYKLIRNLNHEEKFTNAATQDTQDKRPVFRSWLAAGRAGKKRAMAYHHRPTAELYDLQTDPFELHNLADDPELQPVRKRLQQELDGWMAQQGDAGMPAELAANSRKGGDKGSNLQPDTVR